MIRRLTAGLIALMATGVPALAQVQPSQPVASKSYVDTSIQGLYNSISGSFAPLASPTFTGTATMPAAAIGGGTINGTTIGGTTRAAGSFTTLIATTPLGVASGGTGGATAAAGRTGLGAAASGANTDITSLGGLTTALSIAQGGTAATSAAGARTSLGLGTVATQDAGTIALTGGTINGVALGGTTPAAAALSTLSVAGTSSLAGDVHVGGGTNNIGLSRALTINHATGTTGIIFERNGVAAAYFATDGTSFAQLLSASASVPVLLGTGNAATFRVQQNLTSTTKPMQLPASTVANLPTCNAALQDSLAAVSDATNPTYRGALTGGGSVRTAAYCDGSSWTAR